MSSTNEEIPPPPKPRASPLDYRNTDLVSRLLAATPPYLYNSPLVPQTYFFSEMLRSFVQAKTQEQNRTNPPTPPINPNIINTINTNNNLLAHRRSRKRNWNHHQQLKSTVTTPETWNNPPDKAAEVWNPSKEPKLSPSGEKPLELTNKVKIGHKISDLEKSSVKSDENIESLPSQIYTNNTNLGEGNDLILPPPPPIWYPPIYPTPYGIDPFHFFIDLRVSGHIYDRKKEQAEFSVESNNNQFKQSRHTSAFSVPVRNGPINLSNGLKEDLGSLKTEENKVSTNYVMQNLQRVYNKILDKKSEDRSEETTPESAEMNEENAGDGEGENAKDLSALIGLELVVDYVKHEKPKTEEDIRVDSPDLEIIEPNSN